MKNVTQEFIAHHQVITSAAFAFAVIIFVPKTFNKLHRAVIEGAVHECLAIHAVVKGFRALEQRGFTSNHWLQTFLAQTPALFQCGQPNDFPERRPSGDVRGVVECIVSP